ncbi:MAG: glycosyltransferase family 39 protein [Anaerolineae bacterium]
MRQSPFSADTRTHIEPSALRLWIARQKPVVHAYIARPENAALWGIVLLASILRLSNLDLIEFKADEAGHLLRAAEILQTGQLPLVGSRASVGIAKPPLFSLLLTIPLLVSRDPRVAAAFIAVLNVAAVAGTYLLAKRYYGLRVALIAGTLFAVNPWAVVLSRKIFTADILSPFLVLYLYALHVAILDRRRWGWLLAVLSLGLMLYITFSPLPLLVLLGLLLCAFHGRVGWRDVAIGCALVALLFAPYLWYQRTQGLEDLRVLLAGAGPDATPSGATDPLRFATWIHSGRNLVSLAGASANEFLPAHSPLRRIDQFLGGLFMVSIPGMVALGLRSWARWKERRPAAGHVIVALWLLVTLAVIALQGVAVEPHYLVILYPVGFLAMALMVDWCLLSLSASSHMGIRWSRIGSWVLGAALLVIAGWQSYTVFSLYSLVARHDTTSGYGAPLRYWQRTAGLVRRETSAAGVAQVWVLTDGVDYAFEQSPAILHYLLQPDIEAVFLGQGGHEGLLLPVDRPGVYLLTRSTSPAEGLLRDLEAQETGVVLFPNPSMTAHALVAPARSAAEILAPITRRAFALYDSGALLMGYDWPDAATAGQVERLTTYWTFGDVPTAERQAVHSAFNHLLLPSGERVAQRDGFTLPERYWRKGLVLVQWFDLTLPQDLSEGDYGLLTGMYRLNDLTRNRVIDDEDWDAGDSLSLGPLHIGAAPGSDSQVTDTALAP